MAEFIIGMCLGFPIGILLGAWLEFREWTGMKARAWHAERRRGMGLGE